MKPVFISLQILQAETQKLRRRSLARNSVRERGRDDSSPVSELSLKVAHSNSNSSHTDSAESGIDIQTPSERGSDHAPHSPSAAVVNYELDTDLDNKMDNYVDLSERDLSKPSQCSTVVDVHHSGGDGEEVIEMKSFANSGYVEDNVTEQV